MLRSHHELFGLASASFLNSLAHAALPSVTVLYMTFRYGWDARMIGLSMTFIGVCALVVQGGLIGRFVARFGDRAALITGLAFGVAGFASFGLAATGVLFWIGDPDPVVVGSRRRRDPGADDASACRRTSRASCRAPTRA